MWYIAVPKQAPTSRDPYIGAKSSWAQHPCLGWVPISWKNQMAYRTLVLLGAPIKEQIKWPHTPCFSGS